MPESIPPSADVGAALEDFRLAGGDPEDPALRSGLFDLASSAPSLLSLVKIDPDILARAVARPLDRVPASRGALAVELAHDLADVDGDAAFLRALRHFRHRAVIRIALREIRALADVERTSAEMADLAAVVIDAALAESLRRAVETHGNALDQEGQVVPLTVLGMGKLGGRELNLGSDVDLIPFYGTDDATVSGDPDLTVHELYARVVRRAMKMLTEVTADGFCFRVDLRLRPEGSRGPLVNSLASAERYYESWGRTWERAALLRAAPVAGDLAFGARVLDALRGFVYRRAVDPSLASRMEEMLVRSRRELRTDERDVKLGQGGIREAEFFVQTLQLIWGGQHPEVQVPGTLDALERLRGAGLVTDREADTLSTAWALLRRVEHRIHVFTGYQTHRLLEGAGLERIASSLGFHDGADLERALTSARREVSALFASLLEPGSGGHRSRFDALLDRVAAGAPAEELAERLPEIVPDVGDPLEAATHLVRLGRRANSPLGPVQHARQPMLGRLLMSEIANTADPDSALLHLAEFFTRLSGPWSYDRLLLERPRATRRLIGLFGASATLSRALIGHPEDVDLLLSSGAPDVGEIAALHARLATDPDPERMVTELRRIKRAITLSTGLAYAGGEMSLPQMTARLSVLAEHQVEVAVGSAQAWATERFGAGADQLVVVAMGKLGGRELGFGGDLDLVFLYGEDGETAPNARGRTSTLSEVYTRIAQRTMQLLCERDAEGPGYETDLRLRPSGSKGTLVVSLRAFDLYHERNAADWERQALIRARPIAGPPEVRAAAAARFERLAYEETPVPADALAHTRTRIQSELAGESARRYHPKLGYGGLTDVELLVQWLQMRHGQQHRALRTPSTLAALEALAAARLLDDDEHAVLAGGYDFLRRVEQTLKLFDEHREAYLEPHGRSATHAARRLAFLARDGLSSEAALDATYRRHTEAVRACFERHVGPVDAGPPWRASDDG